jgi:hypothetical protein
MTTFAAGLAGIGFWRSALPANSPAYRGKGRLATAPSRRTANWASDTSRRLPGAARAASPRRSAPEAILAVGGRAALDGTNRRAKQRGKLGNFTAVCFCTWADVGVGFKKAAQAGVEVEFTARQCVPMVLDVFRVIRWLPRF